MLARKLGWVSLIMPLSLVSTSRTEDVRNLFKQFRVWISTYDMRPSSLFEGVAQRLSILVSQHLKNDEKQLFFGGYRRWVAEERPILLANTTFLPVGRRNSPGSIPKLAEGAENAVLAKIAGVPLGQISTEHATPILVHRIVRYFVKAVDFIPLFINAHGKRDKSEDYKEFRFQAHEREHVAALLNSTLFYWFWRAHCDGFHCGYQDVYSMPYKKVADAECAEVLKKLFKKLMRNFLSSSEEKAIRTKAGTVRYQEFYPATSKRIIDEIDVVLGQHYGFTEEELDFIINYDIKYRMGREAEIEGE